MRRTSLVAALVGLLAVVTATLPAAAGGNIAELRTGTVRAGERGDVDDLELSADELAAATRRVIDLHAGLVLPDPADPATDSARTAEVVAAATRRFEAAGMMVDTCVVGVDEPDAAACIDRQYRDGVFSMVIVGDFGDLVEATDVLVHDRVTVVGVGGSALAEGAVTLEVDPITQATEQGRAGGPALGPVAARRRGNALLIDAADPSGLGDPASVAAAVEAGLRQSARKIKIVTRTGEQEVHTVAQLEDVLSGQPAMRLALGDGLLLDQADGADLERLPDDLRMIAWQCDARLTALVDLGSRLRGCVSQAHDVAGEAAANVVLVLKTGRDVPASIEIPVYVYRGTVPVGPGSVMLGRRIPGAGGSATDEERAAAVSALAGRSVGLVAPFAPDDREPEPQRLMREAVEAYLGGLGVTMEPCITGNNAVMARACVDDLVASGAGAIVTLGTRADLTGPANAAVAAGVPVIGINETRLGDRGAVYVIVNPRSAGRLNGRMAGSYAARTWDGEIIEAVVLNDKGAGGQDVIANAIERALIQTDPTILVVGRYRAKDEKSAKAAIQTVLRDHPDVRLVVGQNAWRAADLATDGAWDPAIFALGCDTGVVEAIDAGVSVGGHLKGCVDRDPAGAGALAADLLTRLLAGATVPEVLEVPLGEYEP
jgi:hypothetical protein